MASLLILAGGEEVTSGGERKGKRNDQSDSSRLPREARTQETESTEWNFLVGTILTSKIYEKEKKPRDVRNVSSLKSTAN